MAGANSKNYLSIVLKFCHTRRKPNILPYGFRQQGSVFLAIVENLINLQLLLSELIGAAIESWDVNRARAPGGPVKAESVSNPV